VKVLRCGAETGDSLFGLCCHLAKGLLPEEVRNYFAGARLVAFLKDPDGDRTKLRPLAAGDVFRKLVGKVICRQLAGPFQAHFCGSAAPDQLSSAAQFGVAVSSGAEACVHTVQAALEANPQWVHISLDIANAFNSVHRAAIFKEVAASFPQLFSFTKLCYGDASTLLYKMHGEEGVEFGEVLSSEGAQQGDPLGPFYWCVANHPVVTQVAAEVPGVVIPAFMDDVNILGPADRAYQAMGRFVELSRARGGVVVPSKSHVYSPEGDLGQFPEEMVLDASGGLGVASLQF
jgi:hypothetical protein